MLSRRFQRGMRDGPGKAMSPIIGGDTADVRLPKPPIMTAPLTLLQRATLSAFTC